MSDNGIKTGNSNDVAEFWNKYFCEMGINSGNKISIWNRPYSNYLNLFNGFKMNYEKKKYKCCFAARTC